MKKHRKIIIIFTILTIVGIFSVTCYYFNNLVMQKSERERIFNERILSELKRANMELDWISMEIDDTSIHIFDELEIFENQTNQYEQDLKLVENNLLEVENLIYEAENSQVSNMRALYDQAIQKINNSTLTLSSINIEEMKKEKNHTIGQAINIEKITEIKLEDINRMLYDCKNQHQYLEILSRGSELSDASVSLCDATLRNTKKVDSQLDNIELQSIIIKKEEEELEYKLNKIGNLIQEYEAIQAMKESLFEKLDSMCISLDTNMSETLGLTEDELFYLLQETNLIENEEIIKTLPSVIVETVKESPVNEICILSVMSLETGYFKSSLAVEKNNFGGMLDANGKGMSFQTKEEGLEAAIKCIYRNLKGNNTIYDINRSYCAPSDIDGNGKIEGEREIYCWSYKVISIMDKYRSEAMKTLEN